MEFDYDCSFLALFLSERHHFDEMSERGLVQINNILYFRFMTKSMIC